MACVRGNLRQQVAPLGHRAGLTGPPRRRVSCVPCLCDAAPGPGVNSTPGGLAGLGWRPAPDTARARASHRWFPNSGQRPRPSSRRMGSLSPRVLLRATNHGARSPRSAWPDGDCSAPWRKFASPVRPQFVCWPQFVSTIPERESATPANHDFRTPRELPDGEGPPFWPSSSVGS